MPIHFLTTTKPEIISDFVVENLEIFFITIRYSNSLAYFTLQASPSHWIVTVIAGAERRVLTRE
jgi:hypothetical protein